MAIAKAIGRQKKKAIRRAFRRFYVFCRADRLNDKLGTEDGADGADKPGTDRAGAKITIPGPVVIWHFLDHWRKTAGFCQRETHNNKQAGIF